MYHEHVEFSSIFPPSLMEKQETEEEYVWSVYHFLGISCD